MFKMSDKKSQSHSLAFFFFLHTFKLCFYRSDFTTERVSCPVIQRLAVIRGSNCQKTWELDRTHHNCWLPVDAFEMLFYILATNNAENKLWASNWVAQMQTETLKNNCSEVTNVTLTKVCWSMIHISCLCLHSAFSTHLPPLPLLS